MLTAVLTKAAINVDVRGSSEESISAARNAADQLDRVMIQGESFWMTVEAGVVVHEPSFQQHVIKRSKVRSRCIL